MEKDFTKEHFCLYCKKKYEALTDEQIENLIK